MTNLRTTNLSAILFSGMLLGNIYSGHAHPLIADAAPAQRIGIRAVAATEWRTIPVDMLGINAETPYGPSWDDPRLMRQTEALCAGHLRYPGGCVSNYMDWRTGQYMAADLRDPARSQIRVPMRGGAREVQTYRPQELRRILDRTGATPLIAVNMLTDTLESTLEMLAYMRTLDIPIKYVELGNEFYLTYDMGGNQKKGIVGDYAKPYHYPTAESYAQEAKRWAEAINAVYPDAQVAYMAVGWSSNVGWVKSCPRTAGWNDTMRRMMPDMKYVTMHRYASAQTTDPLEAFRLTQSEFSEMSKLIHHKFADKRIWVTEYNNKGGSGPKGYPYNAMAGTWIHGINLLEATLILMETPQVDLLCVYNLSPWFMQSLVFAPGTRIPAEPGGKATLDTKPYALTSSGVTFQLLAQAARNASRMLPLRFEANPTLDCTGGEVETLHGALFAKSDACRGILINLGGRDITVDLSGVNGTAGMTSAKQVSAASLEMPITGPESLSSRRLKIGPDRTVKLKPFSVTLLQ